MAKLSETYITCMRGIWKMILVQVKARMQTLQGLCFLYRVLLELETDVCTYFIIGDYVPRKQSLILEKLGLRRQSRLTESL